MSIEKKLGAFLMGVLILAGCAAEAPEEEMVEEAPEAMEEVGSAGPFAVILASPTDGSTVAGSDVHVALQVSPGLTIAPAGTMDPGTGHHHLFLDTDLTPLDQVIPAGIPGIVHLGQAQLEHHFEGVAPGEHRIIAVVADGAHLPLNPPVVDTVHFTVTAP